MEMNQYIITTNENPENVFPICAPIRRSSQQAEIPVQACLIYCTLITAIAEYVLHARNVAPLRFVWATFATSLLRRGF